MRRSFFESRFRWADGVVEAMKIIAAAEMLLSLCIMPITSFALPETGKPWIDPSIQQSPAGDVHVFVWFDRQFLASNSAYSDFQQKYNGWKRSRLREDAIKKLKAINKASRTKAVSAIDELVSTGAIKDVEHYWVVNGFSCVVDRDRVDVLRNVPGVSKIFDRRFSASPAAVENGPRAIPNITPSVLKQAPVSTWNIQMIGAVDVWKKFNVRGEGTVNVIHDFGFKLDVPGIQESLYVNSREIAGNGIDDDLNGYIDDYHGFDFDANSSAINTASVMRGSVIHGNVCAAIVSGGAARDSVNIGIAPASKWAPAIGIFNFEKAVEWAIGQHADTFSMSYSIPGLGEFRTHWRKVMEQATYCGIVFVSGAGNFAAGPQKAEIPEQMRVPEDIPEAVLGVAGVGRDLVRPPYSSQGPVKWDNDYYKEGLVRKPDFATFNFALPYLSVDGKVKEPVNGNSFAGPHLAGVVSLMLSANPELLPWEVKRILMENSSDILDPGFDAQSGHGLVNAFKAVQASRLVKK